MNHSWKVLTNGNTSLFVAGYSRDSPLSDFFHFYAGVFNGDAVGQAAKSVPRVEGFLVSTLRRSAREASKTLGLLEMKSLAASLRSR